MIPPSFNAAAIIKHCDHPVGVKYGVPKIKIPIRTLIKDDLYIPISMNYHAMGIKVEEEATWTGLGWNLEAGGSITRIVRGENDLARIDEPNSKALGYPFEHIKPCFDDCEENENAAFHAKVCAGEIDSDPDIFFFNILGMKGKFLMTPDHDSTTDVLAIELLHPRKMTAEFDLNDNTWKISDQLGYQYHFKYREVTRSLSTYIDQRLDSTQVEIDFYSQKATTSWYMSKIISPKGVEATFKYDINIDGESAYLSNSAYQKMNINDEEVWDVHYTSYCFPEHVENVQITSEYLHADVYLKSIQLGEYVAHFTKSEQVGIRTHKDAYGAGTNRYITETAEGHRRQQLDQLEIIQGGNPIVTARFVYSQFKSNANTSNPLLTHRLKLDSLILTTAGETRDMGFDYIEKHGLPSKESHARDLWGYNNGEDAIFNITPSDYFNYSQPEKMLQEEGKTKHYSLDHIVEGTISKIDFGGGKYRTYLFDHQEFFNIDEEITSHFTQNMQESNFQSHIKPFIFGGLRIKEIVESYPKEKIYKDYIYKVNRQETGNLIITHYSHAHDGYGHKTSGNHCVKYPTVKIKTGKLFNGHKF
ncbi:hypothetical protein BFP72_08810 [Reichenbachiella sp. 5M10]|nr:hypothetical protein BFP72_08810 [Reichenbachiella sp. 5M10]